MTLLVKRYPEGVKTAQAGNPEQFVRELARPIVRASHQPPTAYGAAAFASGRHFKLPMSFVESKR